MMTQYDFIIFEYPLGYQMELETVFHHGILEDEIGWFDIYLN